MSSQFEVVAGLTKKFFGEVNATDIKIAYIPNAEPTKEATNRNSYKTLEFLAFKEIVVTDIERLEKHKVKNIFDECQAIFVAGGDAIYLMDKLRETGIDGLLTQEIKKGKFYLGSSAGSMIMGEKIKTTKHLGQKTTSGLGLIKFSILPHWGKEGDNDYQDKKMELIRESYHEKLSVMTLRDDQVIVMENDKMEVWS